MYGIIDFDSGEMLKVTESSWAGDEFEFSLKAGVVWKTDDPKDAEAIIKKGYTTLGYTTDSPAMPLIISHRTLLVARI